MVEVQLVNSKFSLFPTREKPQGHWNIVQTYKKNLNDFISLGQGQTNPWVRATSLALGVVGSEAPPRK